MMKQMPSNIVVTEPMSLKGVPVPIVEKLTAACMAIRKSRKVSREACAAIYEFCIAALEPGSGFKKFCTNHNIAVRETQGGEPLNPFILPVKLATGMMETVDGASRWVSDNARVSKYASVFAFAYANNISTDAFVDWLDDIGSMEKALELYRGQHPGDSGDELTPQQKKAFEKHFEQAVNNAVNQFKQQFVFGDQAISITNMSRHNITPGKHTMFVDVAEDGTITPIGLSAEKSEAVERKLVAAFSKPKSICGEELSEIINVLAASGNKRNIAVLDNSKSGCHVTIYNPDHGLDANVKRVLTKATYKHISYIPLGKYSIDKKSMNSIKKAHRGLKNPIHWSWESAKDAIAIKPVNGSVEDALKKQNEGKKQSAHFKIPVGAKKLESKIELPLAQANDTKTGQFLKVSWEEELAVYANDIRSLYDKQGRRVDFSAANEPLRVFKDNTAFIVGLGTLTELAKLTNVCGGAILVH